MLRRRFAILSLLGFTAIAAGCGNSVGLDGLQDAPLVELLTPSVAPGATASLRMRNASATSWGYNGCASPLLQRREGDAWVDAPPPLWVCTAELTNLGAGVTRTVGVYVPLGYAPGTYRVRYRFLRSDGEEAFPVTGAFTVE
jgi:hypothetical protein